MFDRSAAFPFPSSGFVDSIVTQTGAASKRDRRQAEGRKELSRPH
ncbi:hypothetical protein HMPREF9413_0709 [Paenibacillus sp. HGF7]|nr:hypothetical protein HMPREF9413_0709 [Paenibacillus sp. HGF7]